MTELQANLIEVKMMKSIDAETRTTTISFTAKQYVPEHSRYDNHSYQPVHIEDGEDIDAIALEHLKLFRQQLSKL